MVPFLGDAVGCCVSSEGGVVASLSELSQLASCTTFICNNHHFVYNQTCGHHPEEMQRMIPWLTRELYAVLRGPGLSRSALKRVLNLLSTHDIHSRQFWLWVESYLRNHCDHFIHDFYNFARSPYDMIGFDENAVYSGRSTIQMHVLHEVGCDGSDGDAVVLPSEDAQHPAASLRRGTSGVLPRSRSPVAGPSRAVLPADEPSASDANAGSSSKSNITLPTVLQELARGISSTEAERSASDSCVFVGYVKPLHERTPEIISLPSSDQEGDVKESSQMDSRRSLRSSLMSRFLESSRSEYDPHTVRKSQKKKVNRKSKCDGTAKCKAKTSNKGGSKTTPTSTKKRVKTKPEKPQKMLTKKGQSHRLDEVMKKVG